MPPVEKPLQTKKQKLAGIIERGKDITNRMKQMEEEISSEISGERSVHADDLGNKSASQSEKEQVPASSNTVVIPQQNYQIEVTKAKAQLDQIEAQLRLRKSQTHSRKYAHAHDDKKLDGVASERGSALGEENEGQATGNIVPVEYVVLRLHSLDIMSHEKLDELEADLELAVQVETDSCGVVEDYKQIIPKGDAFAADERTGVFTVLLNRLVELRYIESDSLLITITVNNMYAIKTEYPLAMKSPYAPLVKNEQRYFIWDTDVEALAVNADSKIAAVHKGHEEIIPNLDILRKGEYMPVDIDCTAYAYSNREFGTNFEQIEAEEDELVQVLRRNELLFETKFRQQVLNKAIQTEEEEVSKKDLVPVDNGLYLDERNNCFYEESQREAARTEPNYPTVSEHIVPSGILRPSELQTLSVPRLGAATIEKSTPVLYVKSIEIDCLPREMHTVNRIGLKFEGRELEVAENQPVVSGHLLLSQLLIQLPVCEFEVSPLIVHADGFTAFFPLEELRLQSEILHWAGMEGPAGQRCRCSVHLSCLPPISLSEFKNSYQFLDENGEVVEEIACSANALAESEIAMQNKLTASMVARMYDKGSADSASEGVTQQPAVEASMGQEQVGDINNIADIPKILEEVTNNLTMHSSFNVSVYHDSQESKADDIVAENNVPPLKSDLIGSHEIEDKVEELVARNIKEKKAVDKYEHLRISEKLAKSERKIVDDSKMTRREVVRDVKRERNKHLNNKYDISDSDESSDADKEQKVVVPSSASTFKNSEWLQAEARKIYEGKSSSSSESSSDVE